MTRRVAGIAIGAAVAFAATTGVWGQADWPTYGHDDGSTRYSTLSQINTTNVARLTAAWTYHMGPSVPNPAAGPATTPGEAPAQPQRGGRGSGFRASEATPIIVKNVLYLPTPYGRLVALHADSGKEIWSYQSPSGQLTLRGVEYWAGDAQSPPMLLFSAGDKLVELNANTGETVPAFGVNGVVSLRDGVDNGFPSGTYSLSSPPKVYKNLVITGARVQESPSLGFSGDTRAGICTPASSSGGFTRFRSPVNSAATRGRATTGKIDRARTSGDS